MPLDRTCSALRHIGGSQSDEWNDRLAAETVQAIPLLKCETRDQRFDAALQGLIGIATQDEMEGMIAAQLIAAHAAAMACYRGGATADSFERRRDYLNQAVRLSRAFVALLAALQRRRERAQKAAMSAEAARNAKLSKQPLGAAGAPATFHANFAKQPPQANRLATTHGKSAKQPSAGGGSARAQAESAKQPSRAPAPASAESAKQPQAPLAPDLPDPPAPAQRPAAVILNAESAKQPSPAGPAIVRPQPGVGEGTAAGLRFVRGEPVGELIEFAKQPWPIAPALRPGPLALTCRTPGARGAALIARLMEGTSRRIAE
jgi:hypothetical protein